MEESGKTMSAFTISQLERRGYYLYYDDATNLWECWGEDEDALFFNFKNADKFKVIAQVCDALFHADTN